MRTPATVTVPLAIALLGVTSSLQGQAQPAPPGQDVHWKVAGYRHGPSHFKKTYLVGTTPLVAGE